MVACRSWNTSALSWPIQLCLQGAHYIYIMQRKSELRTCCEIFVIKDKILVSWWLLVHNYHAIIYLWFAAGIILLDLKSKHHTKFVNWDPHFGSLMLKFSQYESLSVQKIWFVLLWIPLIWLVWRLWSG